MSPIGTEASVSSPSSAWSRRARSAPRVWIPTTAKPPGSGFSSTISWAIRCSFRRRSSRSSTTFSLTHVLLPGLSGPGLKEPTPSVAAGRGRFLRPSRHEAGRCGRDRRPRGGRAAILGCGGRELRARGGRRRPGRADARGAGLLLPLPQDAAGAGRPGAAGGRLRPSRPRPRRSGPRDFDYSWSGLARWTGAAIDALGIERCHLVVHDIGGPVGFEWAIRNPERVLSLTALNTLVDVASFHRPWPMHPFSIRGIGELWLRSLPTIPFRAD